MAILWSCHQLDYTDDAIIRAIEKLVKVKGLQLQEADLVATICEYCQHFRWELCSVTIIAPQDPVAHHPRRRWPVFH